MLEYKLFFFYDEHKKNWQDLSEFWIPHGRHESTLIFKFYDCVAVVQDSILSILSLMPPLLSL